MIPDHSHIVRDLFLSRRWDLVSEHGVGEFCEAAVLALHRHDPNWGHLRKYGSATQINGHSEDSALYLLPQESGLLQSVDFIRGARGDNAGPAWGPDTPRYAPKDWMDPKSLPSSKTHSTRLGVSLFWLLAGVGRYRDQLDLNLTYLRDVLKADYVRAFGAVAGDLYDGVDPWEFAGIEPTEALVASATDLCARYGLKVQWTIIGGRAGRTLSQIETVVDLFARATRTRLEHIELYEICNEYAMSEKMTPAEMRHCARFLRSRLPSDFPIALSSPHGVHNEWSVADVHAEVERLYGGDSGANTITPHWGRDPRTIWVPGANLGPHAPQRVYNNEWFGPGSSGRGTTDPTELVAAYKASASAKEAAYLYHPLPGIWGGHCHPNWPNENRWANFGDVPNAPAIAAALRTFRSTGAITPTKPNPGEPTVPSHPYPDEPTYWKRYEDAVVALYKAAKRPGLDSEAFRWFARPAHDIGSGKLTPDQAAVKHLGDLRAALSLPDPALKPDSIIWADSVVWTDSLGKKTIVWTD